MQQQITCIKHSIYYFYTCTYKFILAVNYDSTDDDKFVITFSTVSNYI